MLSSMGSGRCWVVWAWTDVEWSGPESMSSQLGLGKCRVEQTDVESFRFELRLIRPGSSRCRVERALANVEPSEPGPMLSRPGLGRCQVELALAIFKPSIPQSMSSLAGSGRYRAKHPGLMSSHRAHADIESNGSWANPTDIKSNGPMPVSSLPSLGRCWVERARTDVEPSGPEPMSSLPGPSWCRAEQAQTNV